MRKPKKNARPATAGGRFASMHGATIAAETFHRADGSRVHLSLTVNPAPEHNAEIAVDNTLHHHNGDQYDTRQWWALWLGLLEETGYRN